MKQFHAVRHKTDQEGDDGRLVALLQSDKSADPS